MNQRTVIAALSIMLISQQKNESAIERGDMACKFHSNFQLISNYTLIVALIRLFGNFPANRKVFYGINNNPESDLGAIPDRFPNAELLDH